MLKNVPTVADVLKMYLEQSEDMLIQNMFYNGWTHDPYVSNAFVFPPNGAIIACALRSPGEIHVSQIANFGGVFKKLKETYSRCRGSCVVESAFSRRRHPFLLKSS